MKHGKKYSESAKLVEHLKLYDTAEALDLCTKTGKDKFDETDEVHVRLGVDSRHADQQVRGAVVLPNGTGKKVRVAVFAKADKAQAALDAGAEIVGAEDLMERIQKEGFMEFDVVIASPDMMGVVGRLGKILGPRGLMSPRRFRRRKPVRSSTVSTKPTSSTARSVRSRSAWRSSSRTSTPCSARSSRRNPLRQRASMSNPVWSLPPWALASRSTLDASFKAYSKPPAISRGLFNCFGIYK